MVLDVPIYKHFINWLQCAQILGYLNIINFTYRTNGSFILFIFGVPILRHFTVFPSEKIF